MAINSTMVDPRLAGGLPPSEITQEMRDALRSVVAAVGLVVSAALDWLAFELKQLSCERTPR